MKSRATNGVGTAARHLWAVVACLTFVLVAVVMPTSSAQVVGVAGIATPTPFGLIVKYSLPVQPLAESLRYVAAEAGVNIFFDEGLALGRISAPLNGEMDARAAIAELTEGSRHIVHARYLDSRTVTLILHPTYRRGRVVETAKTAGDTMVTDQHRNPRGST